MSLWLVENSQRLMNIGKMAEIALDCKSKDRGCSPLFARPCGEFHVELQIQRSSFNSAGASPAFFLSGGRSRLKPVD